MTARSFVWLSMGGGAWSLAANWDDVTDGVNPSLVAPGALDSVAVTGPAGGAIQTITGPQGVAAVAAATFMGNTLLAGDFSAGTLAVGDLATGGLLELGSGSSLATNGASLAAGSMLVNGAGAGLAVAGTLTLGAGQSGIGAAAANLNATSGGVAQAWTLVMNSSAASIYVDPESIVEVGAAGTGQVGQLTIDAGAMLSGIGNAGGYGGVTNNGTVAAVAGSLAAGTLTVGTLAGTGVLQIGAGSTLALNGACGAGQSVVFAGANATLALDAEFDAPAGNVSGFAAGDAIDVRGSLISTAQYTATGGNGGILTLYYGSQVAARIALKGNYTGSVFLTAGDGAGGTSVTVGPQGGGGGPPSGGTSTPDQYAWIGGSSGAWNSAANWQDVTTGASPAAVAPGANNLVGIAGSQGSFTVIGGPANAAVLGVTGEVALTSAYGIGTLTVGAGTGGSAAAGTLDLLAGTTIGAASAAIVDGAISVSGSKSALSVSGSLVLGGGASGVGLPTAALSATAGGVIRAGGLTLGGGSGASIVTDPTGLVEIGGAGNGATGVITVDAGAVLTGNGSANPFGVLIDNGEILASGGILELGSVSGAGTLAIDTAAVLELMAPTSMAISFAGAGAALAFAGARAAPTGALAGFVPGDFIDLLGSTVSAGTLTLNGTAGATLNLTYGGTVVATLAFTGDFTGDRVLAGPDATDGTLIQVVANGNGGGGKGQPGTDQLSWTNPVSGDWSLGANWTDVTTGQVATLPPGAMTPATIAGPTDGSFQNISGNGTSASLLATGDTLLTGHFATGQLTVGSVNGTMAGADAVDGDLDIGTAATLTALQGAVESGALIATGTAALLSVSGTLGLGGTGAEAGGPVTLLAARMHGAVQLGGLTLGGGGGNSVSVDTTATIEVGTLGNAASGAVTIDAGFQVSGNGTLNAPGIAASVVDNGLIAAAGGALIVGNVSGSGSISVGVEADLVLAGTESCPVILAGGGATLEFAGPPAMTGVVSGFVPGDSLVVDSMPVDTVQYQPGTGGVGTLTLLEQGITVGQLLLAGNFAGEVFTVQPDGAGAAIGVQPQTMGGPPPGTVTPDTYGWTGAKGTAWANAGNWIDVTQSQSPAAVAPGQNDLATIQGGTAAALVIVGPADAAALTLLGTVSLSGDYAIGTLSIGTSAASGVLAMGQTSAVAAYAINVQGGIAAGGGLLSAQGTLTLGGAGGGGALAVTGQGVVQADTLVLQGSGSAVATDATGSVEIGGNAGAAAGSVTIDAGGLLDGAGVVELAGAIIDQGTIVASGGTLVLGSVSGAGTLLVGPGAELLLSGAASSELTADFAGPGTLTVGSVLPLAAIADFGAGDQILLPVSGATSAVYAQIAPGRGVLTVFAGTQIAAQLSLLGDLAGNSFSVAGSAGGGTILTTAPDNTTGGDGGTTVTNPSVSGGYQVYSTDLVNLVPYAATDMLDLINSAGNAGNYEWYLAGDTTVVGAPFFAPPYAGLDVEVIGPVTSQTGTAGFGPGSQIVLTPGYHALIAMGSENLLLHDDNNGVGGDLLVGNAGNDVIGAGDYNDTLVGAPGANTVFYASLATTVSGASATGFSVVIQGGGNDTITTVLDNANITTSAGHSFVYLLGATDNQVISSGNDLIACGNQLSNDTIDASHSIASGGDTVFGSPLGELSFIGGAAGSTVVGTGGQILMTGGAGGNQELWCGSSNAEYFGGAGSAIVVGGSAELLAQGGSGAMTVFGGTGNSIITGAAGPSTYVVGTGASTILAAAGNTVWVVGSANISVAGSGGGLDAYAGLSTGNNIFQAGAGAETMWGGIGNDQFFAGSGNGGLVSGGGNDVFTFTNGLGGGNDTIYGFVAGQDTIALHGFGGVPSITFSNGNSVFTLADGTHVTVGGVNLTASSFTTV